MGDQCQNSPTLFFFFFNSHILCTKGWTIMWHTQFTHWSRGIAIAARLKKLKFKKNDRKYLAYVTVMYANSWRTAVHTNTFLSLTIRAIATTTIFKIQYIILSSVLSERQTGLQSVSIICSTHLVLKNLAFKPLLFITIYIGRKCLVIKTIIVERFVLRNLIFWPYLLYL